jgi:hypothetical protein
MKCLVVAVTLCAAVLAAACGVAAASPDTFWSADGGGLANSLQRAGDGIGVPEPCERVGEKWECQIEDDPGSGWSAEYRLTLDRDGCWRGVRVWDPEDMTGPTPLAACLDVLDYVLP